MAWATSLAQDYVIVDTVPTADVELCECALCREKGVGRLIIDDVALTKTPGGALLATYTFNRDSIANWHPREKGIRTVQWSRPCQFQLSRSNDGGQSWCRQAPLNLNMGQPFTHDGVLYMLGNHLGRKDIVVLRSDDDGVIWTEPVTLFEGVYWNTPAAMTVRDGYVYRVFGTLGEDGHAGGGWNSTVVVAGNLTGDLLDPASWRLSNKLDYPGTPKALVPPEGNVDGDHWLEGNIVNVGGELRVLMRCRINGYRPPSILGLCDLKDEGATLQLSFCQFYPCPGAQQKLYVVYDNVSNTFWALGNVASDPYDTTGWLAAARARGYPFGAGDDRSFLILMTSLDAMSWFQVGCVARGASTQEGFQYAAPLIDGDDLLAVVRTADQEAPNQHDANRVTFHRIPAFRSLAVNLHMRVPPDT